MMPYVIRRTTDGAYVAPSGQRGSYTAYLQRARVFVTKEAAEADRCTENERVVSIDDCMENFRCS